MQLYASDQELVVAIVLQDSAMYEVGFAWSSVLERWLARCGVHRRRRAGKLEQPNARRKR